ncbi:MAG: hypothetical protein CMH81_02900 [Nitrospiraceae bacterium]|nr:hypothetical protein [Nitrospiraceae bacterium]
MHKSAENVILIPARSGSTRVKDKNIRPLNGKPLISYAIASAIAAKCGPVFVSTDSDKYGNIARAYGAEVPYLRPKYLSTAKSSSCWVIVHFLKWFKKTEGFIPEFITFFPPTNPLLDAKTLRRMLNRLKKATQFNSIVTYTEPKTHPFFIISIGESGQIKNDAVMLNGNTINDVERTQEFPKVFQGSPACRITRSRFFIDLLKESHRVNCISYNKTYDYKNCIGHLISQEEASDIDTPDDFQRVANYLSAKSWSKKSESRM